MEQIRPTTLVVNVPSQSMDRSGNSFNLLKGLMGGVAGYLVGRLIATPEAPNGLPLTGVFLGLILGAPGLGALAGYGIWKSRQI